METTFTKSQKRIFLMMLVRAREEWYFANSQKKKNQFHTTCVPLTKYYRLTNRQGQEWVRAAWDIFFERISRGDQNSQQASKWIARPEKTVLALLTTNEINGCEAMTKLTKIYSDNKDAFVQIKEHILRKEEKGEVVTKLSVDFIFPDEVTQQFFEKIAITTWAKNKQAEWKNEK